MAEPAPPPSLAAVIMCLTNPDGIVRVELLALAAGQRFG